MDQFQNPSLESQSPSINTDQPRDFENPSTPSGEVLNQPLTSQPKGNTEERIQSSEISENFTSDTPSPEEGGKEYLRLLDLITDAEDTLGKLKEEINNLKDKEPDNNKELNTNEDPRVVVQKLTQDISNEKTSPNLEQIFDSYKQQLEQNPSAPLPKELSSTGEFFPNSNILDLSHLPTSLDPRIEIKRNSRERNHLPISCEYFSRSSIFSHFRSPSLFQL